MAKTATVDATHIKDLKPDRRNARKHNPRNIGMIERSLQEVGSARSIVIDEDNNILAGNGTIEAAGNVDITKLKIVDASGDEIIAVRRSGLTPDQKKRLALFDNRTADTAEWDAEEFARLRIEGFDFDGMFTDGELSAMVDDLLSDDEPGEAPEAQVDRADELQKKWGTERGQLWQIGRHRLLCGDSTSADNVAMLLDGATVQMVYTDPPYGMSLDTDYSKIKGTRKSPNAKGYKYDRVIGDDTPFDFAPFASVDCVEQFWWGGDYYANQLPTGGGWFVWQKRNEADAEMIGNDFELCWSKQRHKRQIIRLRWVGWAATEAGESRAHPTQKPVALASWFLNAFASANAIVLDYFAGSGTTLCAAEQTNRICYAMEIDPKYCAVTLERLAAMGLEPKLIEATA